MEDSYVIQGGNKLKGAVTISGAKNVALKVIIAGLMFRNRVILKNIPKIQDVYELLDLIKSLGGEAEFIDENIVSVNGSHLTSNKLDFLYASKIRVSFMMFAPLLYRFHEAFIPNPGGCRLGARSIDRIVSGLVALGISVAYDSSSGYYKASMNKKPRGEYHFPKPSHTGTELLIMMSVFCNGTVIIRNPALEPEIEDLITFLNEGGAKIVKHKEHIRIEGVTELVQRSPFGIVSDRNEAVTYAIAGIVTKGDVTVRSVSQHYFSFFISQLVQSGAGVEHVQDGVWRFYYKGKLKPSDVVTSPHPGFMTDWQPNWAVLMTQANGISTIHEKVFENRFSYVSELVKMGAKIDFYQPKVSDPETFYHFNYNKKAHADQAIRISGPNRLHNGVMNISDLRAGATLAIAALSASGESVINGASIIERGYENFTGKISALGGIIKKV